jgi:hypothetical protein
MGLCWLNDRCRHITFKLNVDGEYATSPEYHKTLGIEPDDPFPFAGPFQLFTSASDEAGVVIREFERMRVKIENLAT